jgi:hypothetical protein
MTTFDSCFWISITGVIATFIGTVMIYSLKSKCKKCILCFGLVNIERDIDNEIAEEKMEIENGNNYII